jgi:hypothetical protein
MQHLKLGGAVEDIVVTCSSEHCPRLYNVAYRAHLPLKVRILPTSVFLQLEDDCIKPLCNARTARSEPAGMVLDVYGESSREN